MEFFSISALINLIAFSLESSRDIPSLPNPGQNKDLILNSMFAPRKRRIEASVKPKYHKNKKEVEDNFSICLVFLENNLAKNKKFFKRKIAEAIAFACKNSISLYRFSVFLNQSLQAKTDSTNFLHNFWISLLECVKDSHLNFLSTQLSNSNKQKNLVLYEDLVFYFPENERKKKILLSFEDLKSKFLTLYPELFRTIKSLTGTSSHLRKRFVENICGMIATELTFSELEIIVKFYSMVYDLNYLYCNIYNIVPISFLNSYELNKGIFSSTNIKPKSKVELLFFWSLEKSLEFFKENLFKKFTFESKKSILDDLDDFDSPTKFIIDLNKVLEYDTTNIFDLEFETSNKLGLKNIDQNMFSLDVVMSVLNRNNRFRLDRKSSKEIKFSKTYQNAFNSFIFSLKREFVELDYKGKAEELAIKFIDDILETSQNVALRKENFAKN